mmetsp:Transcript_42649/g.102842  ORF Transcript_42649/g.102842 Transcript_42649/m.102842 type:complete len:317 (+) Transcript_42649:48-998(+)
MGNTQPHNKTGRKVVVQKLENAQKTGVLSLSEHKLEHVPPQVFDITKLTTLDLSKNELSTIGDKLGNLQQLKSLNVDENKLTPGTLTAITKLTKLKTLSVNNNLLGKPYNPQHHQNHHLHLHHGIGHGHNKKPATTATATTTTTAAAQQALPPDIPKGLKTLLLSRNSFSNIPPSILLPTNCKSLETLDLSYNNLGTVPDEIQNLKSLRELNLDNNMIMNLPDGVGKLSKLRVLSLRNNKISKKTINGGGGQQSQQQQQPLPESLFTDTAVVDLNLHGNPLTSTQLNSFDGFSNFLARRKGVKDKTMSNLDVCGLK